MRVPSIFSLKLDLFYYARCLAVQVKCTILKKEDIMDIRFKYSVC